MFCARCGKEIDNDSTFCPFCGQKTDEPVESGGGIPKPKTGSAKKSGRKVIGGIAAVAVVVCTGQQKLDTLIVFFYIQSAITVQTHMFPCTVLVLNIPVSMQAVPR